MSIAKFETKAGVRYRVNVRDPNGAWYEQRAFDSKEEARKYEAECIRKKAKGTIATKTEDRGLTVTAYYETKWAELCRAEVSKGWQGTQDQIFRDHIKPVIGGRRFAAIQKADVLEVFSKAAEKGLGEQTRLHIYNVLHKMFEDAIEVFEMRESNPVLGKYKPSPPKVEQPFMHPTVALRFLEYCRNDYYGPMVWLMIWAGLRAGEFQTLTWGDISFHTMEIVLTRQWVKKEGRIGPLKGDKPVRLPMTPPLAEYLRSIRPANWKADQMILLSERKKKMVGDKAVWNALQRLCKDFGVEPLSAHGLRHTCGALWKSQGASRADLKILFNHASETSTERYMHDVSDRLIGIAAKFGQTDAPKTPDPQPVKATKRHLALV